MGKTYDVSVHHFSSTVTLSIAKNGTAAVAATTTLMKNFKRDLPLGEERFGIVFGPIYCVFKARRESAAYAVGREEGGGRSANDSYAQI